MSLSLPGLHLQVLNNNYRLNPCILGKAWSVWSSPNLACREYSDSSGKALRAPGLPCEPEGRCRCLVQGPAAVTTAHADKAPTYTIKLEPTSLGPAGQSSLVNPSSPDSLHPTWLEKTQKLSGFNLRPQTSTKIGDQGVVHWLERWAWCVNYTTPQA